MNVQDNSRYHQVHTRSLADPEGFWGEAARDIDWIEPAKKIFDPASGPYGRWFAGAVVNTCYNALDRHVAGGRADQVALIHDSPLANPAGPSTITKFTFGELLAEVHQLATVDAEIAVPEKEISEIQVGQPVVLKARAYLNQSFQGKVISISPVGTIPTNGLPQRSFLVVTELDNRDRALRPEMTGNAKISCGTRRVYEIVFRRLIRFIRVEFWSWW